MLLLPQQPDHRGDGAGRPPRDHHAPGAGGRQHGGRRLPLDQRAGDRRLHRAGARRRGERLRRRRPGPHRFDAGALPPRPSRHLLHRPAADLRQHRQLRRDDEDGAEGAVPRAASGRAAPGLHGAALGPARAGDARTAGRRLRRAARRRTAALRAGQADARGRRRRRGAGGRRASGGGRNAAALGRPGRALRGGERGVAGGRRAPRRAGGDDAARQERHARGASAGGRRRRLCDDRHDGPFPPGERHPSLRSARASRGRRSRR